MPRVENDTSAEGRGTTDLVRNIAEDAGTLIRKEVELARQELEEVLGRWFQAVAAVALAALLATSTIVLLGFAAVAALDEAMPKWAASLVVAAMALVLSGVAALFAQKRISRAPVVPPETTRTVKEDIEWAKAQLKR